MGSLYLANIERANLEQILVQVLVQSLVHTFVTECHSRKKLKESILTGVW